MDVSNYMNGGMKFCLYFFGIFVDKRAVTW